MHIKLYTLIFNLVFLLLILMTSYSKDFNLKELKEKLPELLGANNAGTDFWITFNPCWESAGKGDLKIYISSAYETTVTVEVPGKGYSRNQKTVPNDIIEFTLTPALGQCYRKTDRQAPEPDQIYASFGVHVSAPQPIIVNGVTRYPYTSDSYLALPVSSLGKEYIVAGWADMSDFGIQYLPCYTGIVSPYDNNIVSFTLGGTQSSKTAGGQLPAETRNYTLSKGDVLLIASLGHLSDLSGSRIKSSKPVSVISSNFCAQIPVDKPYCDLIMEMELPDYTWGKHYFYTPIFGRMKNSIVRIFSKEPGTKLFKDGMEFAHLDSASGLENKGWISIRAEVGEPKPLVFSGDKPVYIEQYNCSQYDDSVRSDPFMMLLPPFEQFQKEITFNTPGIRGGFGFVFNYINIIHTGTESDNLPDDLLFAKVINGEFVWQQLDSINKNTAKFSIPVNGKTYYNTTILLPGDGVYKIRANDPFTAYSYGFSAYDSYGHPASVSLNDFEKPDTLAPNPTWILDCDGTIKIALVEDMPRNNDRSKLSQIIFWRDSSTNYTFTYQEFIPGEDALTNWNASVIDTKKDAQLVVTFSDRRGNDTTIVIKYVSYFLNIKPDVDFGKLKIGDTIIKDVWGFNELAHQIKSDSIILKSNNLGFEIINNDTKMIIEEGDSVLIQLRFIATKIGEFTDSIGNQACPHQSFYSSKVHAIVDTVNAVEEEYSKPFYIYPNPSGDYITLKNLGINYNEFTVKIYDIRGICIFEKKYTPSINNLNISTADFSSGIYYLQIINDGEIVMRKFCVLK